MIVPQLSCHSESTVSACESTASKPKKRKKDEGSGEMLFGFLVCLFVWWCYLETLFYCVLCVSLNLSHYMKDFLWVFS